MLNDELIANGNCAQFKILDCRATLAMTLPKFLIIHTYFHIVSANFKKFYYIAWYEKDIDFIPVPRHFRPEL